MFVKIDENRCYENLKIELAIMSVNSSRKRSSGITKF
jgi:hypothetical protein